MKIADGDFVTKLDLEKFKGVCAEKLREAVDQAISAAVCANGVSKIQIEKDNMTTTIAYEKAMEILRERIQKQDERIEAGEKRTDRNFLWIVGIAITSLISVVLLLASILLGKI